MKSRFVQAACCKLAFYNGDPGQGGTLIETAVYGGPLVGGQQAEVSVPWTVPAASEPRTLFVVVDPNLSQEDRDRTNNTATRTVMEPDLTISEIGIQRVGSTRLITVRVANVGALAASDVGVTVRKDAIDGEVLAAASIEQLAAGAYHDISAQWAEAPEQGQVFAIVDEAGAIEEFDEQNNWRSARFEPDVVLLAGDFDYDGDVDLDDYTTYLAPCYTGPSGQVSAGCGACDLDGDADVDLIDFATFQCNFTE